MNRRLAMKYRKKAIEVVDAWHVLEEPIPEWAYPFIDALTFTPKSWLVKDENGVVSLLTHKTFNETYEAVE